MQTTEQHRVHFLSKLKDLRTERRRTIKMIQHDEHQHLAPLNEAELFLIDKQIETIENTLISGEMKDF